MALAMALSACGFTPVHKQDSAIDAQLSGIAIGEIVFTEEVSAARPAQLLRGHLEDTLNPRRSGEATKYRLHVALEKARNALVTEQDREITRYNLLVTAKYRLNDISTNKQVTRGTVRLSSSFDAATSDFATFAAEENALTHLMRELAEEIRLRLAGKLDDGG